MADLYRQSDAAIFASTCENMPNILIEAMSSGLPIACSQYPPMPEFLKDGGVYFDPLDPTDIARSMEELFMNPARRVQLAATSFRYSREYRWDKCTHETMAFLAEVLEHTHQSQVLCAE